MFENIGQKIKTLASVICWIGIIGCTFWGFSVISLGDGDGSAVVAGLIIIATGILSSWVGSFLLYGFGELIYQTTKIARNTENDNGITRNATTTNKNTTPSRNTNSQILSDSMKCFKFSLNSEKTGYSVTCSEPFPYSDAIIPSEYEGLPVVEISQFMFYKTNLETVKIPESIKIIGDNAFYGCKKLKQMTFTGTNAEWFSVEKGDNWNGETGDYIFNLGK